VPASQSSATVMMSPASQLCNTYTVSHEKGRHHILTYNFTKYYPTFKNSFTCRFSSKFVLKSSLKRPPYLTHCYTALWNKY